MSAEEVEAQAQIIAGTFGRRAPGRRTRLAAALEGKVQHMVATPAGAVAAWRVGEGPAVLLVHGFADSQALWAPLMEALIAKGRAFVAFDLLGHGRSDEGAPRPDAAIESLFAVAAALGPIRAVAAHSMSAATAICALAEGLPAARAVMISTALPHQREFVALHARAPDPHPASIARARELLIAATPKPPARLDASGAAARLKIPGLLVHCRDDAMWMPEATAHIASRWAGAETYYTRNLGHRPVARDPEIVALVAAFLDRPD